MHSPLIGRFLRRDSSVFPAQVLYGDIVKGLPLAEDTCAAVYSAHVIEHLSLNDCRKALRNVYNILVPGGKFRLVAPDLEFHINAYVRTNDAGACHRFMQDTLLGVTSTPKGAVSQLRSWLGHSKHLWMWDYQGLKHELEETGFVGVRRAAMGDSGDTKFNDVETSERWRNALGTECGKPV